MRYLTCALAALWLLAVGIAPLDAQSNGQGFGNTTGYAITTCGSPPIAPTPSTSAFSRPTVVTVNSAGQLCISGSISASLSGFTPSGNYSTLTSTASSARAAMPSGSPTVVVAYNTGTTVVSCILGSGSVTAVANEDQIQPNGWFSYTVGSNADLACINQAGDSTSNLVVLSGGSGLATGAGGGGTVGGATAANQSSQITQETATATALGTPTDTAWTSGSGSVVALLKAVNGFLSSAVSYLSTIATNTGAIIPGCKITATTTCNVIGSVYNGANTYNTVAVSQTAQALTGGSGGATGDYLSHCVLSPNNTTAGSVIIYDNSTAIFTMPSATLSNLVPFTIPFGAKSVSGAFKVTTPSTYTVLCVGAFT